MQWDVASPRGPTWLCRTANNLKRNTGFRTLSQRLEELSAVPAGAGHAEKFVAPFQEKRRLETNLRDHILSSLAKSIRG
jgi:hypothetical protein